MDLEGYTREERSISRKDLRALLYAKNPNCHWCGVLTDNSPETHRNRKKNEKFPDNSATIEHLFDRFHPEDRYRPTGHKYKVIACWKCNHDRAVKQLKNAPKEFVDRRRELGAQRKKNGIRTPRPIYFAHLTP